MLVSELAIGVDDVMLSLWVKWVIFLLSLER